MASISIEELKLFLELKTRLFIRLKNRRIYNGYVIKIENNHFILKEQKLGDMPILLDSVLEYEKWRERESDIEKKKDDIKKDGVQNGKKE